MFSVLLLFFVFLFLPFFWHTLSRSHMLSHTVMEKMYLQYETWMHIHIRTHQGMYVCMYLTEAGSFSRSIPAHVAGADDEHIIVGTACSTIFKHIYHTFSAFWL